MNERGLTPLGLLAVSMLGRPYKFGAKWPLDVVSPPGPVDCSGFVRWLFWRAYKVALPDGSYFQHKDPRMRPVSGPAQPDDLVFLLNKSGSPYHVGVVLDARDVVECHGPGNLGHPEVKIPTYAVVRRPRAWWEAFPGFSGYHRFKP